MKAIIPILVLALAAALCDAAELAASYPEPDAKDVAVSASLHLRFSDALDLKSLAGLTLHEKKTGTEIAVKRATDLTNASLTLSPVDFLRPMTVYEIRGTESVKSATTKESLKPFQIPFTTGTTNFDRDNRLVFEAETVDRTRSMTTVLFGPDRKLYAADAFGALVRWDLDESGKPVNWTVLDQDPKKSRQYIDLEWDPEATGERLILWASYSERLTPKSDPRHFFTGTIARLELGESGIRDSKVIVTGLPHGREKQAGFDTLPHQPNGLCFHKGKLYQSVGSTSSSGGPANWGIAEQPLSGCILEIDYRDIEETLDVYPKSGFDPSIQGLPLRIFATGVRNALEIVAHSNGRLYTAVNINDRAGPRDGVPDDPDIPGDQNALIRKTTPDHESLYLLERGRHYGFPNPARGQYVLNGGNPTNGEDPFEIDDYPPGTKPEPGFAPELMFPIWQWGGTSPNGMIEYRPGIPHSLTGTLLCCYFSAGDIAVMTLGSDGLPTTVEKLRAPHGKKLNFNGPLDLCQDPQTGNLYIADFGKQSSFGEDGSMIWLQPVFGK